MFINQVLIAMARILDVNDTNLLHFHYVMSILAFQAFIANRLHRLLLHLPKIYKN